MAESPYQIAKRLLVTEPPASRNKNFAAYDDPRTKRGFALYRRLRALVAELAEAERQGIAVVIEERQRAGRTVMVLQWAREGARRAAWLEPEAWDALLVHPVAARVLGVRVKRRA